MNLLLFLLFHLTVACQHPAITKLYRTDYEYNKETDAFYKLHLENSYFDDAEATCISEGAKLAAVNYEDKSIVRSMFEYNPDIEYIWVGDDGEESEDSYSTAVQYKKKEKMNRLWFRRNTYYAYELNPFICKVDANDAPYDETCDVLDKGFQYWATVGSCYKVSDRVATWNEADAECQMVKSHLVVVNSEAESEVLSDIMKTAPRLDQSVNNNYFIAGFRSDGMSSEFHTIINQTLEEAGFSRWLEGEPNNYEGMEYCGALHKAGTLNDIQCFLRFAFICEKEVRPNDIHCTLKATPDVDSDSAASHHTNLFIVLFFCLLTCFGDCIHS